MVSLGPLVVCLFLAGLVQAQDDVEAYAVKINESIASAERYVYDTDASRYKPNSEEINEYGSYDYIIIGAGASGCVIANRLSENSKRKVLLLEAGGWGNVSTEIPGMAVLTYRTDYNWGYASVPQTVGCQGNTEQRCDCPRGRGVGGSTLINGMVVTRGHPKDFDQIGRLASLDWSYASVLKYFKKSENFTKTNPSVVIDWPYHGKKGEWKVDNYNFGNSRTKAFMDGNEELGYKSIDYNSNVETGVSLLQINKHEGRRQDTGTAFIKPILSRTNFKLLTEAFVTKIEINNRTKTAQSVLFTKDGKLYRVNASKEIILSAGAVGSPQLLLLSGVGPKSHLESVNVPVIKDLPGVGKNLIDHVDQSYTISFNSNETTPALDTALQEYFDGTGILTTSGMHDGIGFYVTTDKTYPDLELITLSRQPSPIPYLNYRSGPIVSSRRKRETTQATFLILGVDLNPKSRGSITLKSNSPYDYPLIDNGMLTNSEDLEKLDAARKLVMQLLDTKAYKDINATLQIPDTDACKDLSGDEMWHCIYKQSAGPGYHLLGSCSIGKNSGASKGAVVNPQLKVIGIKKLRVADASIIPIPIRGHTAAAALMVGEKAADLVKASHLF